MNTLFALFVASPLAGFELRKDFGLAGALEAQRRFENGCGRPAPRYGLAIAAAVILAIGALSNLLGSAR